MELHGILFDLDGTLADTIPICIEAHRRSFERFLGRTYTDEEIVAMFGPCEMGIVQTHVPDRWEQCLEVFLNEYDQLHAACTQPFPGVPELLDLLTDRKIATAVVTGKGPRSAEISLKRLGLNGRFEIVECGSPAGVVKPDAIRRILEGWNIEPEHAAYVGDAPADVESARRARVLSIAAAWAPSVKIEEVQARGPDLLFHTVSELTGWIVRHSIPTPAPLPERD